MSNEQNIKNVFIADHYKIVNGIYFSLNTPDEVARILSTYYTTGSRIKLYFGDTDSGKDWVEEHDTIGYVGRSTGEIKIPILVYKRNSSGGGAILDSCIVKIKDAKTGTILYQHPKYYQAKIEIAPSDLPNFKFNILFDGVIYSRHKTLLSAERLRNKLV